MCSAPVRVIPRWGSALRWSAMVGLGRAEEADVQGCQRGSQKSSSRPWHMKIYIDCIEPPLPSQACSLPICSPGRPRPPPHPNRGISNPTLLQTRRNQLPTCSPRSPTPATPARLRLRRRCQRGAARARAASVGRQRRPRARSMCAHRSGQAATAARQARETHMAAGRVERWAA